MRRCWEQRFPLWQNILEYNITSDATVEPLFRIPQQKQKISNATVTAMPRNSSIQPDVPYSTIPDVSAAALRIAAERYRKQNRPIPGAPCTMTLNNTQEYLDTLPPEDREAEKKRLFFMCNLIPYIVPIAGDHPYQTQRVATLDGKEYTNGQLLFNSNFVSFKNNNGLQRIEWEQIPSGEFRKILKYYISLREKRNRSSVKRERQQELAAAYVHYAVFCQWYGIYDEAEKYALLTLKYLPGNTTNKLLTQWLLQ